MSVLQTVQKKQQTIYLWTDSAKKQQFTYGQTVQKNCTGAFTVLQTVQKKQQQFTYGQTVQKTTAIYIWTDSAKKQQTIYIWTDSAKKLHWSIYSAPDSAKKTTAIYIWTDSAKNNSNLHMDSTYLQTVQKTMCKIHIHILSTLSVL